MVSYPYRVNSIQTSMKDGTMMREDDGISEQEKSSLESVVQPKIDNLLIQESDSLISFENESSSQTEIIRQPSPPPLLADVQDLIPASTPATQTECGLENASNEALVCSEDPLQLHIVSSFRLFSMWILCYLSELNLSSKASVSFMKLPEHRKWSLYLFLCQSTELMDSFMKLAKSNTDKNLETCGVLAGSLVSITNILLFGSILEVENYISDHFNIVDIFLCIHSLLKEIIFVNCHRKTENFTSLLSLFQSKSQRQIR